MVTPDREAKVAECRRRSCGLNLIPIGFPALAAIALALS